MQLSPRRVVNDLAIFAVAHAQDGFERTTMREFSDGVVELTASDKIDVRTGVQRFIGLDVSMRADERDFQGWVCFFDLTEKLYVAFESDCRRVEHEELVVLADFDGLLPVHLVR